MLSRERTSRNDRSLPPLNQFNPAGLKMAVPLATRLRRTRGVQKIGLLRKLAVPLLLLIVWGCVIELTAVHPLVADAQISRHGMLYGSRLRSTRHGLRWSGCCTSEATCPWSRRQGPSSGSCPWSPACWSALGLRPAMSGESSSTCSGTAYEALHSRLLAPFQRDLPGVHPKLTMSDAAHAAGGTKGARHGKAFNQQRGT